MLAEWEAMNDDDLEDEKEERIYIEGEETQEKVIEQVMKARCWCLEGH